MTRFHSPSRRRFLQGLAAGSIAGTSLAGRRAPRRRQEAGRDRNRGPAAGRHQLRPAQPPLPGLPDPPELLRHADPLRPDASPASRSRRAMDDRARRAVGHARPAQGREVPQRKGAGRGRRREELREGRRPRARLQHAAGGRQRRRGHGARRRNGPHQVQEGLARRPPTSCRPCRSSTPPAWTVSPGEPPGAGPSSSWSGFPETGSSGSATPTTGTSPRRTSTALVYKVFGDSDAMVAALQSGIIDLCTSLPPKDVARLSRDFNMVRGHPGALTYELRINVTKPPFDRKEVRQALHYAIDRKGIVKRCCSASASRPCCPTALTPRLRQVDPAKVPLRSQPGEGAPREVRRDGPQGRGHGRQLLSRARGHRPGHASRPRQDRIRPVHRGPRPDPGQPAAPGRRLPVHAFLLREHAEVSDAGDAQQHLAHGQEPGMGGQCPEGVPRRRHRGQRDDRPGQAEGGLRQAERRDPRRGLGDSRSPTARACSGWRSTSTASRTPSTTWRCSRT